MSTDQSANVHAELSKEGQIKLGTNHPIANHGEPAKEGDENTSTDHSESVLDKPAADANMEEEDPEYEEDPEEIEIYEDDEDMDDAHAEEQIAEQNENTNDREVKPEEVATADGGNNKSTTQPEVENITNIHERAASIEEKQSVAEKGDSVEGGEKVVSKEVKPAKDEVVDKDLLQAFRYFDINRAGYLKVDDLKCILHNLGKFLSSRDVKVRYLIGNSLHLQPIIRDSMDQNSTLLNCEPPIRIWNQLLQQSAKQEKHSAFPYPVPCAGRIETRSGSGSAREGQGPEALWIKPPRDSSHRMLSQLASPLRVSGPVDSSGSA
ncbi:protein SHORT ROOT IN SALT MEDIUM 1-like [Miscanthus floridulus]|uniref:protein SHORT ROOT IN SALT MEDIUM 1-like n=1 Tax=Miscanthus floridulus TaxID=154761 RepID=UPI00345893EB